MSSLARTICLAAILALTSGTACFSQALENGQRLSERWCVECHTIGTRRAKPNRAPSFATIAARPDITAEMLAAFLLLPHATMPNVWLSQKDASDLAAFIIESGHRSGGK